MQQRRSWLTNRVRILQELPLEDAQLLDAQCELVRVRRRQLIFMPGDPSDRVFLLKSGLVKLSRVTEEGRELTLMFLSQGEMLGETALFDGGPRGAVAEAYEDCVLASIPRQTMLKFIETRPQLALSVARLMSERRRKLESKIEGLLFRGAHARLAMLFLELAHDFGVRDSRGVIINLRLTHREMAGLIGATRETVSFALLDLKREGLLETDGKRVVLLDLSRLELVAVARVWPMPVAG